MIRAWGVGVLVIWTTGGCGGPGGVEATLAIERVNVVPMSGDAVELLDRTVLLAGDRILRVAPSSEIVVPDSLPKMDGRGLWLTPGLVDSHVHLMDRNDLPLLLSQGITRVLNLAGAPQQLQWREALARGDLIGPALHTSGPQIKVEADPIVDFERAAQSVERARELVRHQAAAGYDFVKVWGPLQPDVYGAVVEAAHSEGIRVTGHIPRGVGLAHVLSAGQSSVAHIEEYWNKVLLRRRDSSRLTESAEASGRARLPVITTLVTYEAIAASVAPDIQPLLTRPERQLLDPVRQVLWEPGLNRYRTPGREGEHVEYLSALEYEQQIALVLHESGALLLAGSDAGEIPGLVPGVSLHRELELLVDAGLSTHETLRTATVNPGRYLTPGEPHAGTVTEGAPADLLLLAGSPLEDISNTRAIEVVFRRGVPHEPADLERTVRAENENTKPLVDLVLAGRLEEAREYALRRGGEGAPPAMTPMLFLAYALAQQDQGAGAVAMLELAAELHPDNYLPIYMLGMAALGAGDRDGASGAMEQVLRMVPLHDGARAVLESVSPAS